MLTWLGDVLRPVVRLVEEPGWETRTRTRFRRPRRYTPVGVMVHHTAPPVPYPVKKLYRSAQINVKMDGTVYLIAAGYQYASGIGMRSVLDRVKKGLAPLGDAPKRGTINGNPWWINIETDHPGDGSPIPPGQYNALIRTIAAICAHEGWAAARVDGHREFTRRKPDPRWGGTASPMPTIRADVDRVLTGGLPGGGDDMAIGLGYPNKEIVAEVQTKLHEAGFGDVVGKVDGLFGPNTGTGTARFQTQQKLPATGTVDWVTAMRLGVLQVKGAKGDKGDKGEKGDPGPPGPSGRPPETIKLGLTATVLD